MDPPPVPEANPGATEVSTTDANTTADINNDAGSRPRRESSSQQSENSQTAADFIRDQMQLEADAREALPYVWPAPLPFLSTCVHSPVSHLASRVANSNTTEH